MPPPIPIPHPIPDPLAELIAQRFRALGEPTRIKLLDRLRQQLDQLDSALRGGASR